MTTTVRPDTPPPGVDGATSDASCRPSDAAEVVRELASCTDPTRAAALQEQLIRLHMGVAASIALRYRSRGISSDDLQQVAYLALTKAARRFDATSGHHFLAFAVPTIQGEVRRYFRDHGWVVRPPRRVQELQYRLWAAESRMAHELGRPPTPNELSLHLEAPLDDVLEALDLQHCFDPASLDRPVDSETGGSTLGSLLAAEDGEFTSAEARTILAPVVRRLDERDRHIVKLRFYDGLTQSDIAERLGVTQVQVSRLLARIYRDLRTALGPLEPSCTHHAQVGGPLASAGGGGPEAPDHVPHVVPGARCEQA